MALGCVSDQARCLYAQRSYGNYAPNERFELRRVAMPRPRLGSRRFFGLALQRIQTVSQVLSASTIAAYCSVWVLLQSGSDLIMQGKSKHFAGMPADNGVRTDKTETRSGVTAGDRIASDFS